jgi:predicted HD phosphohydrolase
MTRQFCLGIVVLVAISVSSARMQAASSALQAGTDAEVAAKASPELVGALSKEIGATPEQAAGAAGALFGVA